MAVWFTNDAFDHDLINSSDSIVARINTSNGKLIADLPPAAVAILHHPQDKFYFQIVTQTGERIAGDAHLPLPQKQLDSVRPRLRDAQLDGEPIRLARVRVPVQNYKDDYVLVQVAETLNSRHAFTNQILLSIILPQLLLIALGAAAVWRGVDKSLLPLKKVQQALEARNHADLTPVSEAQAPHEVQPLVRAMNELLVKLSQDIEKQKRFVANAAHQFRTPLAGLKTYIYCAKRLPADNHMLEVLDKVDAATQRMTNLSNKLLALAKAEPDQQPEQHKLLDLNHIVGDVTAAFIAEATKRNISLNFIALDKEAVVQGDAGNLTELVANLVENAVFYTPSGGHINIRLKTEGQSIVLDVCDDGPGIPDEEKTRVFERFYRVLGSEQPGSGLGLAIVKEIAVSHNASVQIKDPPQGQGTLVEVEFPKQQVPPRLLPKFS